MGAVLPPHVEALPELEGGPLGPVAELDGGSLGPVATLPPLPPLPAAPPAAGASPADSPDSMAWMNDTSSVSMSSSSWLSFDRWVLSAGRCTSCLAIGSCEMGRQP